MFSLIFAAIRLKDDLTIYSRFLGSMKIKLGLDTPDIANTSSIKNANIFLSISLNTCFGCSKALSHRDGAFEYPQLMFWLRIRKLIYNHTLLPVPVKVCSRK